MPEEFDIQKLKSEYPELFEKVPQELIELAVSEETSLNIVEICLSNGIENEEKIEKIAYRVALALLGQIPKENFTEILERGAKIDHETARKIFIEINRLIFSQIKEIRQEEIRPDQLIKPSPLVPEEEKLEEPPKKDVYREPIE